MTMTKKRYLVLAVTAALGLSAALVGSRVRAQNIPAMVATGQFGMLGAIQGEIVRLSISNINLIPPDPCRATIEFVDGDGNVLLRPDGTPVRRDVALEAGQSAFVQFNAGALLGRDQVRLPFRPVVQVTPPDPNIPPPCVPSLEIINATTGGTRLAVPGAAPTYAGNHNETLVMDR